MKLILASGSPRRRELLAGLNLDFEVRIIKGIAEDYPGGLSAQEVPVFISREKALAYNVAHEEVLLTADTVVVVDGMILGKPQDDSDARRMLRLLSGKTHQVVTGVTITTCKEQKSFAVTTDVTFKELADNEIDYYISHCHPLDKAGAYGIQGNHAPLSAAIVPGEVIFTKPDGTKVNCAVSRGLVDVSPEDVKILSESVLSPDEIDEEQEKKDLAKASAETRGEQSYKDFRLSQLMMAKAIENLRIKKRQDNNINN